MNSDGVASLSATIRRVHNGPVRDSGDVTPLDGLCDKFTFISQNCCSTSRDRAQVAANILEPASNKHEI